MPGRFPDSAGNGCLDVLLADVIQLIYKWEA